MKKLVNVAIMATLVIFATTAIFVGCKKEENKVVDKTQVLSKNQKNNLFSSIDDIDFINGESVNVDYGLLHNEVAYYIITNYNEYIQNIHHHVSVQDIAFFIEKGEEYFLLNYPEYLEEIQSSVTSIRMLVDSYGDDEYGQANIIKMFQYPDRQTIDNLFLSLGYSSEFSSILYPAIQYSAENFDMTRQEMVDSYLRPIAGYPFSPGNERELFIKDNVFIGINDYSAYFWNGESMLLYGLNQPDTVKRNPNLPPGINDCAEWAMIMMLLEVFLV